MSTAGHITTNLSKTGASLGNDVTFNSGTFSFPQTGYYKIECMFALYRLQSDADWIGMLFKTTNNNSTYTEFLLNYTAIEDVADQHSTIYNSTIFDVTDISNDKFQLHYECQNANNIRVIGHSTREMTYIRFYKIRRYIK